ncbi:MAG: hypothetical protein NVS4B12_00290 [Ktedonobacteraceae bacterium]
MSQNSLTYETIADAHGDEHSHGGTLLGPLLCWAVVFADIGTSVYYVPGILYGNVGNLAGFFVLLTMSVFILLTLKYAEVTHRFPQGGGVVTVAASAFNKWVGALGGMFILVDYFLTAAISCLSGMQYLSVVLPVLGVTVAIPFWGPIQVPLLFLTIGMLVLLGLLNWVGISESAKVSFVGAVIAFVSDIAILLTVFTHLSFSSFLALFSQAFAANALTPQSLLIGFAGSFLAFSGLESISQLSPVMRTPRKKIAGIALLLVVLTIGITSPLLTMFSTLLQPHEAKNSILRTQLVSLLGGHWGNHILQTEIAISASALLVFASNTAIIGAYHVFLALSRLGFFPAFILKRNQLRGTPHYSIMLATGIPIVVLLIVLGNIDVLGDMYAFGLLGAFTLTCLGLDVVRYKDRRAARTQPHHKVHPEDNEAKITAELVPLDTSHDEDLHGSVSHQSETNGYSSNGTYKTPAHVSLRARLRLAWGSLDFALGILTTALVIIAWSTNLVAKPLATLFGGSVTIIGMVIAYFNYKHQEAQGQTPIHVVSLSSVEQLSNATLAVLLTGKKKQNSLVVQAATKHSTGKPLAFLYIGEPKNAPPLQPFEYYDPYLYDESAIQTLRSAETMMLATNANAEPQFLYRPVQQVSEEQEAEIVTRIWQTMHPHEILIAADDVPMLDNISPNRIRYETLSGGKVAHLVSQW